MLIEINLVIIYNIQWHKSTYIKSSTLLINFHIKPFPFSSPLFIELFSQILKLLRLSHLMSTWMSEQNPHKSTRWKHLQNTESSRRRCPDCDAVWIPVTPFPYVQIRQQPRVERWRRSGQEPLGNRCKPYHPTWEREAREKRLEFWVGPCHVQVHMCHVVVTRASLNWLFGAAPARWITSLWDVVPMVLDSGEEYLSHGVTKEIILFISKIWSTNLFTFNC